MKFSLEINMDNDAFQDSHNGTNELVRVLEQISHQVFIGSTGAKIRDSNGNSIGQWEINKLNSCRAEDE